jgi:hypothetical protein
MGPLTAARYMRFPRLQERVDAAKRAVERACGSFPGERHWLIGTTPSSYGNARQEVSLFVLEGSPPQGFILVCGGNRGRVLALSMGFRRLRGLWEQNGDPQVTVILTWSSSALSSSL